MYWVLFHVFWVLLYSRLFNFFCISPFVMRTSPFVLNIIPFWIILQIFTTAFPHPSKLKWDLKKYCEEDRCLEFFCVFERDLNVKETLRFTLLLLAHNGYLLQWQCQLKLIIYDSISQNLEYTRLFSAIIMSTTGLQKCKVNLHSILNYLLRNTYKWPLANIVNS